MSIKQRTANFFTQPLRTIESDLLRRIVLVFMSIVVFICIVCFSIYEAIAFFLTSLKDYMSEFWTNIVREWRG